MAGILRPFTRFGLKNLAEIVPALMSILSKGKTVVPGIMYLGKTPRGKMPGVF